MKKLLKNLFFFSAVGSVAILASCGGDDEPVLPAQPSIEVEVTGLADTDEPYEAVAGETATITVTVDVPGTFNVLYVRPTVDGTAGTQQQFARGGAGVTANADNTEATVVLTYEFDEEDIDSEFEFEFEVVDDSDQTATTTLTITVVAPPSPDARIYTEKLLYAPLGDLSAEGFFSSNTGLVYSPADVISTTTAVSTHIDFGYYYGNSDKASLASPAAYANLSNAAFSAQVANWSVLNATVLKTTTLTASAFTEVTTWADIDEVYEASTDEGSGVKTDLQAGQVLAFETDEEKEGGAKRGLILVKEIVDGNSDGDYFDSTDYIELEILVQEEVED